MISDVRNPAHSTLSYVQHCATKVFLRADNLRCRECKTSSRAATNEFPPEAVSDWLLHFGARRALLVVGASCRHRVRRVFRSETMTHPSSAPRTVRQIRPGDHVVVIGAGPA